MHNIRMKKEIKIFCADDWRDYELLDTGGGEKLERFGPYTFARPYESALWQKTFVKEWAEADGKFLAGKDGARGGWEMRSKNEQGESLLKKWEMNYKGTKFFASPTPFRHLGFFPEQASHWDFIEEKIKGIASGKNFLETAPSETKGQGTHTFLKNSSPRQPKIKFLNLFGYTGVASLFALRAGAEVTHVDASKQILEWVKENQKISGLGGMPMRIILDDALKFLEREVKRGNRYECVMMDPPKFGRGPKGEVWKIEKDLPKLLAYARKVLSDNPLFVILTSYATDSSSLALGYALEDAMRELGGKTESGELCIFEKSNSRFVPLANTAIWSSR